MKNVITGLLKKANGKYASIETFKGTPVLVVELGTFKPSAGDFFDSCKELFTNCKGTEFKLNDELMADIEANTDNETFTITVGAPKSADQNPQTLDTEDVDDEFAYNDAPVPPFKDVAQLIVKPHFKKDGTFDKISSVRVVVNIANIIPSTFKAKQIISMI